MANTLDAPCFICQKHRGEVSVPGGTIYADELVYAGHAQIGDGDTIAYLGYLMAEPRRHVNGLGALTREEAEALGLLISRLSRALEATELAEHVYAFVLGDGAPHLHIHVVARYPGAPREFRGVHVDEWPDAPHGGPQEIEQLCRRLREWLAENA